MARSDMLAQSMREQKLAGAGGGSRSQTPPSFSSRIAWILLAVFFAHALWAQKAEPLRIALKEGTASVEGRLRGRQQTDYETTAGSATTLTLQLSATPARSVALKLYTADGVEMPLRVAGMNRWSAELSHSGDYGISVLRIGGEHGTSTYKLKVRIR